MSILLVCFFNFSEEELLYSCYFDHVFDKDDLEENALNQYKILMHAMDSKRYIMLRRVLFGRRRNDLYRRFVEDPLKYLFQIFQQITELTAVNIPVSRLVRQAD